MSISFSNNHSIKTFFLLLVIYMKKKTLQVTACAISNHRAKTLCVMCRPVTSDDIPELGKMELIVIQRMCLTTAENSEQLVRHIDQCLAFQTTLLKMFYATHVPS